MCSCVNSSRPVRAKPHITCTRSRYLQAGTCTSTHALTHTCADIHAGSCPYACMRYALMRVRVYACMHSCTHACMRVCVSVLSCAYAGIRAHAIMYECVSCRSACPACICAYLHMCAHARMRVCMCAVGVRACVHACMASECAHVCLRAYACSHEYVMRDACCARWGVCGTAL